MLYFNAKWKRKNHPIIKGHAIYGCMGSPIRSDQECEGEIAFKLVNSGGTTTESRKRLMGYTLHSEWCEYFLENGVLAENADKDDTPLVKDMPVDRKPKRKKITEKISSKRSKTPAPSWTASCSWSCTDARTESWTESRNEICTEISTEIGKESTVEVNPDCNYCKKCKLPYVSGAYMIECECCDYWYHFECENVVKGQEDTDWHCSDCLKMFAESEANQKTVSNQGSVVDEPANFNDQPGTFNDQPESFNNQPGTFNDQLDNFNDQLDNFNDQPESFNNQPGTFNDQLDNFNDQPSCSNNQPGNFNNQPGSSNDLPVNFYAQPDDVYDQSVNLCDRFDQFCDYLMQAPIDRKLEPMLQQTYAKFGMVLFKYDAGKEPNTQPNDSIIKLERWREMEEEVSRSFESTNIKLERLDRAVEDLGFSTVETRQTNPDLNVDAGRSGQDSRVEARRTDQGSRMEAGRTGQNLSVETDRTGQGGAPKAKSPISPIGIGPSYQLKYEGLYKKMYADTNRQLLSEEPTSGTTISRETPDRPSCSSGQSSKMDRLSNVGSFTDDNY